MEGVLKVFEKCIKSGLIKSGQVRIGQVRTGQVRAGQVRTGQVRTGHIRTGHRAVNSKFWMVSRGYLLDVRYGMCLDVSEG